MIAVGVNRAEACRVVGVNRRTWTRWRFGRTVSARDGSGHQDPAMVESPNEARPASAQDLSEQERVIAAR